MANQKVLSFFTQGGVFFFDENNASSESTYYAIEDLMGEPEGETICQTEVDDEGLICIFYDESVMDDEEATEKYNAGNFVKSI